MPSLEEQAQAAEAAEEFPVAFDLWIKCATETNDVSAYCKAGLVAIKLRRWDDGEHAFRQAHKLSPTDSRPLECLGLLCLEQAQSSHDIACLRSAERWFIRAITLEASARALTFLGRTYINLEDRPAAKRALDHALSLDARYEEAYLNLAELEKEENPSLSIDYLEKAIDIDPGYRAAFQLLGILLQRSGDLARAEKHFRRCVELDPLDQWSRLYLANCLAVQRKDSEAEAEYRMAVAVGVDPSAREFFARFLESRLGLEDAERVRHSQG